MKMQPKFYNSRCAECSCIKKIRYLRFAASPLCLAVQRHQAVRSRQYPARSLRSCKWNLRSRSSWLTLPPSKGFGWPGHQVLAEAKVTLPQRLSAFPAFAAHRPIFISQTIVSYSLSPPFELRGQPCGGIVRRGRAERRQRKSEPRRAVSSSLASFPSLSCSPSPIRIMTDYGNCRSAPS